MTLREQLKQDREPLSSQFPLMQVVVTDAADQSLRPRVDAFNILLRGVWFYGQWVTDRATQPIPIEQFEDMYTGIRSIFDDMGLFLDMLEKAHQEPLEKFLINQDLQTTLMEKMEAFAQSGTVQVPEPPVIVEIPIRSNTELNFRFKQFSGIDHTLSSGAGFIVSHFQFLEDFPDKRAVEEKPDYIAKGFDFAARKLQILMSIFEDLYPQVSMGGIYFANRLFFDTEIEKILRQDGSEKNKIIFNTILLDNDSLQNHLREYTVKWHDAWCDTVLEEIAKNTIKAYIERDEKSPERTNEARVLKAQLGVYTGEKFKDQLSASELRRFNNHPLSHASHIFAMSFIDQGCGVDPTIEENGLIVGQSVHHGSKVGGTGKGISFLNEVLEQQYRGMILVHNRKDGYIGSETRVCLPASERVKNI